jgi:hypothetical protein
MAGKSAILSIKIITDASKAGAGITQTTSKLDKFRSGMQRAAIPAAAMAAALITVGKKAFDSASRLQQAQGGVEAVFDKSAARIERWATTAVDSVGLSTSAYEEFATQIGGQLKNAGLPMDQVTSKTKTLIQMGADLAATYGGTTADAVDALSSAFRGESDPAEKFNLNLKASKVAAQMAADGTDKLKGKAADAAHAQAILELATKQSADAHKGFAREADTAAGQQQRATAAVENASAAIGTALLPIVAKAAELLAVMAKWVQKNSTVVAILAGVILTLAVAVQVVNGVLWLMALNPVTLTILAIVAGVALLVGGMILLYKKSTTAKNIMDAAWSGIKTGLAAVKHTITNVAHHLSTVWQVAVDLVTGYVGAYVAYFKLVFAVVKGVIRTVTALFRGDWRGVIDGVKAIIRGFRDFFRDLFNLLPGPVQKVITKITTGLGGALTAIIKKIGDIGDTLAAPFVAMYDALTDVIGSVKDLIGWIKQIKIPDLGGLLSHIPGVNSAAVTVPTTATRSLNPAALRPGGRTAGNVAPTGPTIIVQGALDPDAVARQIRSLLTNHDRRIGLRVS